MLDNNNRVIELERKVQELQRKLDETPSLDDVVLEVQKRLSEYEQDLKIDAGEINLKKNLVFKNRKGKVSGRGQSEPDNTVTMSFNEKSRKGLNHIFIGTDSALGSNNNNFIGLQAISDKDLPQIANNGGMQLMVAKREDLDSKGLTTKSIPNLGIHDIRNYLNNQSLDGIFAQMVGTGDDGFSAIAHQDQDSFTTTSAVSCYKNGIALFGLPTSDPGKPGYLWIDGNTIKIST